MTSSRRTFLKHVSGSLAVGAVAGAAAAEEEPMDDNQCLDYGRSFICNKASFNAVRFWVESRTTLIDEQSGHSQVFYQCGSCKSENTFAEQDLFVEDNYDFLPILGGLDWLIFRRPCRISDSYRRVQREVWGEPVLKLRYAQGARPLDTFGEIRDATADAAPIVAQTEIRNESTGLKAVIECPVKTMNVSLDDSVYQVDTGPAAYPDLARRTDPSIDCLSLAFVAFNAPHFADFIVEQPTPVAPDDEQSPQAYHYSRPFSLPARNRLLALPL